MRVPQPLAYQHHIQLQNALDSNLMNATLGSTTSHADAEMVEHLCEVLTQRQAMANRALLKYMIHKMDKHFSLNYMMVKLLNSLHQSRKLGEDMCIYYLSFTSSISTKGCATSLNSFDGLASAPYYGARHLAFWQHSESKLIAR
jgi:hypothetical protein